MNKSIDGLMAVADKYWGTSTAARYRVRAELESALRAALLAPAEPQHIVDAAVAGNLWRLVALRVAFNKFRTMPPPEANDWPPQQLSDWMMAQPLATAQAAPAVPAGEARTFSDFIRNATPEEKEALYLGVIDRANARQNAALSAPQTAVQPWPEGAVFTDLEGTYFDEHANELPREQPQPVHSSAGEDALSVLLASGYGGSSCVSSNRIDRELGVSGVITMYYVSIKEAEAAHDALVALIDAQLYPSDTAAGAQKPKGPELDAAPLRMRICETEHLGLRPNQLYLFTVDATCKRCVEMAQAYAAPQGGQQ